MSSFLINKLDIFLKNSNNFNCMVDATLLPCGQLIAHKVKGLQYSIA